MKIESVYPAIISTCESLFEDKNRLHNPYQLDENPDIIKKDAWGLRVGDASKEIREFCNLTTSRSFTFVLMRQMIGLASKEDGFDSVTTKLLVDQQKFLNTFYSPDNIGQPSNIDEIDIGSISGIQEMTNGEKRYLFCEVTFNIIISEAII